MFANVERDIKVNIPSADRQVEREMRVFFLIFDRFFYSGNSSTYFKVCVDLCKKSDRPRCLLSTILTGKEERNSVVIHR